MHFIPLLCLALSPIQIDGSFTDWKENVYTQEDATYLYKRINIQEEGCLQQLPEQLVVKIGEYTVIFSPKGKGYGVSCKKDEEWISPYEAGVVFAPTTASTTFEIRVNKPRIKYPVHPFTFSKTGDFRVVSWNVQFGNLLDDKERSARILKALRPDVLLIQELDGEDTSRLLEQFLEGILGGRWNARVNEPSGTKRHHRLVSAIATSTPTLNPFSVCSPPLKALGSTTYFKEKPVNFISLHLRCCGGPTSEAELQRQEEATEIHHTISNMQSPRWVIAGDWNLVGTRKPLAIVQSDTLASVEAFQPDGLLNATWSDTTSSFTPGRLDWMLYSPAFLEVTKSFVLDSSDLDSNTLLANDLRSEDTRELSDHLPLVADFTILK